MQAAILLLADESREVLQTLLCFLNDVVHAVEENQMTAMNLAVCLAPSLFHLNLLKKESSPRWVFLNRNANPKPDIPQGYLKKNYMHCTSTWGSVSTSFIIRKCLEEPDSCSSESENYPGSIEECPL